MMGLNGFIWTCCVFIMTNHRLCHVGHADTVQPAVMCSALRTKPPHDICLHRNYVILFVEASCLSLLWELFTFSICIYLWLLYVP